MTKTLTDNDLVSTSEIARQLRIKGIKKPFGVSQLSTDLLIKKGFQPVIKIREGSYWSREVLNKILNAATYQDDDDQYAGFTHVEVVKAINENFNSFGEDVLEIKEKLDLIMKAFDIKK